MDDVVRNAGFGAGGASVPPEAKEGAQTIEPVKHFAIGLAGRDGDGAAGAIAGPAVEAGSSPTAIVIDKAREGGSVFNHDTSPSGSATRANFHHRCTQAARKRSRFERVGRAAR